MLIAFRFVPLTDPLAPDAHDSRAIVTMASVSKSVLVEHSAQQMFDLVERVEDYPQFLPWCGGTTILERTPTALVARIEINFHGVRANFTTANRNEPPERIAIHLKDGPFRQLDGTWRFRSLAPAACKVEFDLRYEFAGATMERLIGPVFNHIATSFIDAFVKRADQVDQVDRRPQ
jgi:ribosome-associated toxin RatA of RatAB toxin-antitoxin module